MTADVERSTLDQRVAASLKGFGFGGIASLVLILAAVLAAVPLAAVFVLVWAWLSYTPFGELGSSGQRVGSASSSSVLRPASA